MTDITLERDIEIRAERRPEWEPILSDEAMQFVAALQRAFGARREELLAKREARKLRIDAGELPDFLPETKSIRESAWTVAPIPPVGSDASVR